MIGKPIILVFHLGIFIEFCDVLLDFLTDCGAVTAVAGFFVEFFCVKGDRYSISRLCKGLHLRMERFHLRLGFLIDDFWGLGLELLLW